MKTLNKIELLKQFGGVILLNKPSGPSSQAVITQLRRFFAFKKIGHGGTLDPLASGLLVCAISEATKFLSYADLNSKMYEVTAQLGLISDTEDRLGNVIVCADLEQISKFSTEQIVFALNTFKGEQLQVPPQYSALKHQGKCRYVYARRGEIIPEASPRKVTIEGIENIDYDKSKGILSFQVQCSSGTYVRSLVRDLGQYLGCGALLTELKRLAAAPFSLKKACDLEQLLSMSPEKFFSEVMQPIETLCPNLPKINVSPEDVSDLCLGRSIYYEQAQTELGFNKNNDLKVAVFDKESNLFCGVGEIEIDKNILSPKRWIANFMARKIDYLQI